MKHRTTPRLVAADEPHAGGRPSERAILQSLLDEYQDRIKAITIALELIENHHHIRAKVSHTVKLQKAIKRLAARPIAPQPPMKAKLVASTKLAKKRLDNRRNWSSQFKRRQARLKRGDQLVATGNVLFVGEHLNPDKPVHFDTFVQAARGLGYNVKNGLSFVSALNNGFIRHGRAVKRKDGYLITEGGMEFVRRLRERLEAEGPVAPGSYSRVAPTRRQDKRAS